MYWHVRKGLVAVAVLSIVALALASAVNGQNKPARQVQPKLAAKSVTKSPTISKPAVGKGDDLSKRLTPEEMKAAMVRECIQPDYRAWERVTVGMPVAEVREILGQPIEDVPPRGVSTPHHQFIGRMTYGRIWFDSPSMPQDFSFMLSTLDGKIQSKEDPFNSPLAKTAKPAIPVLMTPADGVKLRHYPRFLDFRWFPSSGEYPISYTVEVQSGHRNYDRDPRTKAIRESIAYNTEPFMRTFLECKIPYSAWSFVGSSAGRWRVKAKNLHGESDWTEWRTFDFTLD
jgi:hypothetical protein